MRTFMKRKESSKRKWNIARSVANKLRIIPTIYLVGVTGGLSVHNASQGDDIDLFFICARGTVWISRALVIVLLFFFSKRRIPGSRDVEDAICPNMFLGDDALAVPIPGILLFYR